jgi:hypothetical protein
MADIAGFKAYFRNVTQNPAVTKWEILAAVEAFTDELHATLASDNAITAVDNGGPITLRCEAIDGVD